MKVTRQINIQTDIIGMVEFCINNIKIQFNGHVYQQTVGIPMGTNYDQLVICSFLYEGGYGVLITILRR